MVRDSSPQTAGGWGVKKSVLGRRSDQNARAVINDVVRRGRVVGCPLIATDGFEYYIGAVGDLVGSACVYGQVLKTRRNNRVIRIERRVKIGTEGSENEQRAGAAKEFALNIWPTIEQAAEAAKTANQTKIAAILNKLGYRSVKGAVIRQALIARYIWQAGKEAEWDELLQRFPKK